MTSSRAGVRVVSDNIDRAHLGDPANTDFELRDYPFFLIAQVDQAYSEQMETALHSISMSRSRWRVLMGLRDANPRSVSELATLATMKLSTISRVVEKLRGEGLVSCASRASDNRVTDVFLEPPGRAALERIIAVAGNQYQRAISGLSDSEVQKFVETLRRVRQNLERSPIE